MPTNVMIGMNEVGALGSYATGERNGIAYELVRVMGLVPSEGILHQYIHSLNPVSYTHLTLPTICSV